MITGNCDDAVEFLKTGSIVCYPTEAIYGLGCDPWCETAVNKIYKIKNRTLDKPFLLVASSITQLSKLIDIKKITDEVKNSWPGHNTWLIPSIPSTPKWLIDAKTGLIGVRVSNHPTIIEICKKFDNPIISTSANKSHKYSINNKQDIINILSDNIDFLVDGSLGNEKKPSIIKNMITNEIIRK